MNLILLYMLDGFQTFKKNILWLTLERGDCVSSTGLLWPSVMKREVTKVKEMSMCCQFSVDTDTTVPYCLSMQHN